MSEANAEVPVLGVVDDAARSAELSDEAFAWVQSKLARDITLKLTPVLLPIAGALAYWLQDAIGIDMQPAAATGYVVTVVVGVAALLVTFVRNHGEGAARLGEVLLELERVREAGRQAQEQAK
jgi:hypothetical protein